MAKKNTAATELNATPAPANEGTAKVGRPAGQSTKSSDIFTAVDPQPTGVKIAPQAQGIVNILLASDSKSLTREKLIEGMVGVVQTRQPEGRILSYYQKVLVDGGFVTITPGVVSKSEAKAEEPAGAEA